MEQTTPVANAPEVVPAAIGMPGFFALLSESFSMYGQKWKSLLKMVLALFGMVMFVFLAGFLFGLLTVMLSSINAVVGIGVGIVVALAGLAAYIYLSAWVGAAMIIVLRDQDTPGFREAMKRARPYIGRYFEVSVLSGLITLVGFLLLIIPGIIFSIWYMFARYLVITDNEKGMAAISKSREYARGYFWNILLLGLLGGILLFALQMLIAVTKIPFLDTLVSLFVTTPLSLIYSYLIFSHLRQIKGAATTVSTPAGQGLLKALAGLGILVLLIIIGLAVAFAPQIATYIEKNQPSPANNSLPVDSIDISR